MTRRRLKLQFYFRNLTPGQIFATNKLTRCSFVQYPPQQLYAIIFALFVGVFIVTESAVAGPLIKMLLTLDFNAWCGI